MESVVNARLKELIINLGGICAEMDAIEKERNREIASPTSEEEDDSHHHLVPSRRILQAELTFLEDILQKSRRSPEEDDKAGSPSATAAAAAALTTALDDDQGNDILNVVASGLPNTSTYEEEIVRLYERLDPITKLCLLTISAFPEKSIIKKRVLFYWWIGEGLLDCANARAEEERAEAVLKRLTEDGFLEPFDEKIGCPSVGEYRLVHPLIRSVLLKIARKTNFFDVDHSGNFLPGSAKSHKACLISSDSGSERGGPMLRHCLEPELKEVITLFNFNYSYLDLQSHWFPKLRKLRVLQLGRWQCSSNHHIEVANLEFLTSLSKLKDLRYFSLQGISRITYFPVSFKNFLEMRVLDLRACHNLEELPHGMGRLVRLTHLDISECYLLHHMPRELSLLVQLRVLKGFVMTDQSYTGYPFGVCKLAALSNLKNLKKLSLYIRGDASATKDELLHHLQDLKQLCCLTITWLGVLKPMTRQKSSLMHQLTTTVTRPSTFQSRLAQSLDVPRIPKPELPRLQKLDLRCFPWTKLPAPLNPMELSNLKKLYVRGGNICVLHHTHVPSWKIEVLRLKYLHFLDLSSEDLKTYFPKLTYLDKVDCPKLDSLSM